MVEERADLYMKYQVKTESLLLKALVMENVLEERELLCSYKIQEALTKKSRVSLLKIQNFLESLEPRRMHLWEGSASNNRPALTYSGKRETSSSFPWGKGDSGS